MTYSEQLKDPRWQRKRLEVMQRDEFKCCECGSTSKTLHVHHRYYVSHRYPWEYPNFCYRTVCDECHYEIRQSVEDLRQSIDEGSTEAHGDEWEWALNILGDNSYRAALQYMEACK
jgi:5-methylcytosine-specific restriction endonuclease McrA